ncbi:hypothetical protein ACQ86N_40215 [Puia sp. P3]|uniref:hypothetical protein n=1 Tax=Puia sp. P3 TaxID=3423952 RepID=UPI003D677363
MSGSPATISFAGLLLGIATYVRSETLILVVLFLPLIFWSRWRRSAGGRAKVSGDAGIRVSGAVLKKTALAGLFFLLPSLVGYYLPVQLYVGHYLPVHYDVGGLVNNHLSDWSPLLKRYGDIVNQLLLGTFAIHLWGYLFYITCALFVAELVFVRRFSREARFWLYAIAVTYLALGLLGFVFPLFNLTETTKRSLFKIMPLFVFYLANNELLLRLSRWLARWEVTGGGKAAVAPAVARGAISPKVAPATARLKSAGGPPSRGAATSGTAGTPPARGSGTGAKKTIRRPAAPEKRTGKNESPRPHGKQRKVPFKSLKAQ